MSRANQHHGGRGPFVFVTAVVTACALWLLCTGSRAAHELLLGGLSVAATTVFLTVVYRQELQGYDLSWRDALALWRTPWYLLSGIWEILVVLLDDLRGERAPSIFRVCGFPTSKDDPRLVTRRALATAYTSLAPNFIVVGIDFRQSRMLFHQLRRSRVPVMTRELGAVVGRRERDPGDAVALATAPAAPPEGRR